MYKYLPNNVYLIIFFSRVKLCFWKSKIVRTNKKLNLRFNIPILVSSQKYTNFLKKKKKKKRKLWNIINGKVLNFISVKK